MIPARLLAALIVVLTCGCSLDEDESTDANVTFRDGPRATREDGTPVAQVLAGDSFRLYALIGVSGSGSTPRVRLERNGIWMQDIGLRPVAAGDVVSFELSTTEAMAGSYTYTLRLYDGSGNQDDLGLVRISVIGWNS